MAAILYGLASSLDSPCERDSDHCWSADSSSGSEVRAVVTGFSLLGAGVGAGIGLAVGQRIVYDF